MKTGVCSITFRSLNLEELAALTARAGLAAVEWGGDVHVPHGDLRAARRARQATLDAGLEVSSYGSYYSPLDADGEPEAFEPVLESAVALGTDTIRIWAGKYGSEDASDNYRSRLIEQTRMAATLSAEQGIQLAFEFHVRTLLDTNASALQLLEAVDRLNVYSYWQPPYWRDSYDYRLDGLVQLDSRRSNLHVFQWDFDASGERSWEDSVTRRPLSDGAGEWLRYLSVLPNNDCYALLEFVRDDSIEQFLEDAAELKRWIKKI